MSNTKTAAPINLVMRRTFNAPRERVFDAWTNPDVLSEIFAADNYAVKNVSVDARLGGNYSFTFDVKDEGLMTVVGTYREFVRPERLVSTWIWEEDDKSEEQETLLTLEFKDLNGKTELTLTHENFRSEESRTGHEKGWNSILDRLEKNLA